jgi:hypothetical protein
MNSPDEATIESPAELSIEQEIAAAMELHKQDDTPVVEEAARDETGKFAAKESDENNSADKSASNSAHADIDKPETDEPVIPDRYGVPPQYAKKAIREKWGELPGEVRQELHDREREIHQQMTRFDEERTFGKKVKEVVAPYEGFIKSLGADPVQAFDYLIKTDYALRTAPIEQRKALFMKAAADYGVQFDGTETAPINDPRLESMQQQLARLEQERNADIQARQEQEQRSIEQQIADFSSRPENVYFDRVSPTMAALLQSGQADSLEKAYEMAVFADPETRALQLAAQAEQSQRTATQIKSAQAAKARSASVSVTGAPGPAVPASSPTSAGSLEDDIRNAIAASSGRI